MPLMHGRFGLPAIRLLVAAWLASALGCAPAGGPPEPGRAPLGVPPLAGFVDLEPQRDVMVNIGDFAKAATVSLIDPETGNTLSTTLTDREGNFVLRFTGAYKPGVGPYFLEAAKGLGPAGSANRAGYPLMRVRTLASLDGDWRSISAGSSIILNRSSTALSAVANLKGLTNLQTLDLLGKLELNKASSAGGLSSKDTFTSTAGISTDEYLQAVELVNQALDQDTDPIGGLAMRPPGDFGPATEKGTGYGMQPRFAWRGDGPVLTGLDPDAAAAGATVKIRGQGLPAATDQVTVTLDSLACTVTSARSDEVAFQVPAGARTGILSVKVGRWIFGSLSLTVN